MASYMTNKQLSLMAGIDPKTGLPCKHKTFKAKELKENVKKMLRIIDEQDAVCRYVWHNLPEDISSQELERMIYYKGQLAFFYDKTLEKFYFMPYAKEGTLDYYGRFNQIHPIPFYEGTEDSFKAQEAYLSTIKLNVVYGLKNDINEDDLYNSAVLIHDYTKQLSQTIIPRQQINDGIIDVMADCVPFMRTALLASTGIKGVRVADADQQSDVLDASRSVESAALNSEIWVPITGGIDYQELTNAGSSKAEEYLMAMQSLDNLRLSTYGIDNGGLFEKKSHLLQSEADVNGGPVGLVLQDGLSIRQQFCNIVNSIWGLGIWCEPAENIIGSDLDGDGLIYDRDPEMENIGLESSDEQGGNEDASTI